MYFAIAGRFMFTGFLAEIDMSMYPAPPEDGGGIFMSFKVDFRIGSKSLGMFYGYMDLTPFYFPDLMVGRCRSTPPPIRLTPR